MRYFLISTYFLLTSIGGLAQVYTVSKDGTGDFVTIQEAINQCKAFPDLPITINIKNGVYEEKIKIYEWNTNLILKGEDVEKTIIVFNDSFKKINKGRNSTFFTATFLVEANDTILKNLTIKNISEDEGQAIALGITATRVGIVNCKLFGNQDTLYLGGEGLVYINQSYVEGTTDFIFGNATAYFKNCEIRSKKDSYISAASTSEKAKYGFVFDDCKITANAGVEKVFLGRPWRDYAKTIFIRCDLGKHIRKEGWHNWNKKHAENTVLYAEYGNYGDGSSLQYRVPWAKKLSKFKANKISINKVLFNPIKPYWYENL